ncbi:hypothetical protein GN958_ATG04133, partial [Phytophthora infestans]
YSPSMKALLHRAHLHRWDALKKSFDSIFVWRYHEEDPDDPAERVYYPASFVIQASGDLPHVYRVQNQDTGFLSHAEVKAQTYVVRYLAIAELLNEGTVVRPQG